jgi:hypothetical protein
MNDAITLFTLAVPQAELEDLNRRIDQTRWPDAETVNDWTQAPRSPRSRRWSITGVSASWNGGPLRRLVAAGATHQGNPRLLRQGALGVAAPGADPRGCHIVVDRGKP